MTISSVGFSVWTLTSASSHDSYDVEEVEPVEAGPFIDRKSFPMSWVVAAAADMNKVITAQLVESEAEKNP